MFNQAPIVAAARGRGLRSVTNSFKAFVLISIILLCIRTYIHVLKEKNPKAKYEIEKVVLENVDVTTAESAKARGKAQANIMIIPNCKASSSESAIQKAISHFNFS